MAIIAVPLGRPPAGWTREIVLVSGGAAIPLGRTADFSDTGAGIEVRFRHYNTGHSAWELGIAYFAAPVSGEITDSIDYYEALIRQKNLAAQQASQPGQGYMLAEYGDLEVSNLTAQLMYRFSQRGQLSPFASVGGGLYHWRLPFRLRFYNVPSFGEQHAYDPMGASGSQFVFDDRYPPQVIDFTKDATTGGLNAALGLDWRATRSFGFEAEGRVHYMFSSGTGVEEDPADDQSYVENMSFLRLQGTLYYRF